MNIWKNLNNVVICLSFADREIPSVNRVALEKGLKIRDLHIGSKTEILSKLGGIAKYDEMENTIKFNSSELDSELEKFIASSLDDAQYCMEKVADDATDSLEVESVLEYLLGPKTGVRFAYDDCSEKDQIVYAERLHDFIRHTAYKGSMYVTGIYYYKEV